MPKLLWEDQSIESIPALVAVGETEERARKLLTDYIRLARTTPMPEVLDFEHHPDLAATASPYLARDEEIHDLMLAIVKPLPSRYHLQGHTNFERAIAVAKSCGVTLVCNHLSHFDAAVLPAECSIRC